ncbi:hypothetical protein ACFQ46_09345 [Kineococcus sp. GCM10028916]|uniref:hypothetical protein n=1 Tax=Kineococcus sp. GCM10028916 TaxID=3273394 RepID=UPI0036440781
MPDVEWNEVCEAFSPKEVGDLPDAWVEGGSVADWQAVFDLVSAGTLRWEYREAGRPVESLPAAAELFTSSQRMLDASLQVWLTEELHVIFWFLETGQVNFDVNVAAVRDQGQLDALCAWLRTLGQQLRKPVIMAEEGAPSMVMLTYDVASDRVVVGAMC